MLMLPGWGGWSKCEAMQTEKKGPGTQAGYPGYWLVLGNTRVACSWEGNRACNNDPPCHASKNISRGLLFFHKLSTLNDHHRSRGPIIKNVCEG